MFPLNGALELLVEGRGILNEIEFMEEIEHKFVIEFIPQFYIFERTVVVKGEKNWFYSS